MLGLYTFLLNSLSRVQLRLPMGSTSVVEVNYSDTLATLRQKASEVCAELHYFFPSYIYNFFCIDIVCLKFDFLT